MKFLIVNKVKVLCDNLIKSIKDLDGGADIIVVDNLYNLFSNLNRSQDFDFVFLDFAILGDEWRRQIKRLCGEKSNAKIVFYSDVIDSTITKFLFDEGCFGYIPKKYEKDLLSSALFLIFNDCPYIPPTVLKRTNMADGMVEKSNRLPDGKVLTPRQIEVLGFLGKGFSNKQIAFEMSVSEATVKLHMNALLKNLEVNNRTQAVVSAQSFGFL